MTTILVAEDSLVIRAVVRAQLEEVGYDVLEATDGEEAVAVCRDRRPDSILLDIEMPGLDGFEVLARLKASPELRDIPVVFLTGRTTLGDLVEGLRAGAHDYLCKPFQEAELIARIGAAVRVKNLQDQLRLRNEELDRVSRTDGLTGVYNRRHLEEKLRSLAGSRDKADHETALLMFDLDHFKQVNDTAGHAGGDEVLREFCRRLHAVLRPADVLGRWGGEEFVALLPRTDLLTAMAIGEEVRRTIAQRPVNFEGACIAVTVSIGCATGLSNDAEDLMARADEALYRAKAGGRNRVVEAPQSGLSQSDEAEGEPPELDSLARFVG